MKKLMETTLHPGKDHELRFFEGSESVALSRTCHKCMQPVSRRDYYKCTREGCHDEYYLHKECVELKDLPQVHHPLHPQHPLAQFNIFNTPCEKSFVCSFCGETEESMFFYQCSDDQCEFYLDITCAIHFTMRTELLDKYEIQHVLHHHENHRLSPYIVRYKNHLSEYENFHANIRCSGCANSIVDRSRVYKCNACPFYLHTECSQVPKEAVQHPSHPHHPLVLFLHHDYSDDEVRSTTCLKWIKSEFYLHCNHCPTFNLDLNCYFHFKPTFKHEAHEHPLAYFPQIHDDDVRCYACNTPCKYNSFHCFTCNFHMIHYDCHYLPNTVNYYDHVHPFTLTTSFKQDGDPTTYYCDICEKRRDTDRGIYLCKECPFMAHFECALSLSDKEKKAHADAPWRQKIEEGNHKSNEEENMTLTNEEISVEIFDQLNVEIEKLEEVTQQLIIKERGGEQLTEKLQELDKRLANTKDILRRLEQSVKRN